MKSVSGAASDLSRGYLRLCGKVLRRKPRRQDPHQLRRRRRPHFGPGARQVVLDGRVRQAQAVRSSLLGPSVEDSGHDEDFAVSRASGAVAFPHASRLAAASHSSRPSMGMS